MTSTTNHARTTTSRFISPYQLEGNNLPISIFHQIVKGSNGYNFTHYSPFRWILLIPLLITPMAVWADMVHFITNLGPNYLEFSQDAQNL